MGRVLLEPRIIPMLSCVVQCSISYVGSVSGNDKVAYWKNSHLHAVQDEGALYQQMMFHLL